MKLYGHAWNDRYPPTNTSLDWCNRHRERRLFHLKLRGWIVRHFPRFDRSPKANHLLRASDCYGSVTPPKNPLPRYEYELLLMNRNGYQQDESA
jgi:hypothetical protein